MPEFRPGSRREDQAPLLRRSGAFADIASFDTEFVARVSRSDYLDAWRSHLSVARQAGPRFDALLADIGLLLDETGRSELEVPYVTRLWFARKRGEVRTPGLGGLDPG